MTPRRIQALFGLVAAAGAMALVTATPTPASACGGFFCSQVPVDQTGEQIVFTMHGDQITATIQISYQGEAEDFAWVVPVASLPDIDVGSQTMFTQLRWRTDPQYNVQWQSPDEGNCDFFRWQYEAAAGGDPSAPPSAPTDDGGVQVLDQKEVGPYDTVTLQSDDASALIEWLNDNGYDQPEESTPLIEHYVESDMLFVALKLTKDADTGDIQPLALTFTEASPCVPLVLTQIAASPDMPVRVWVFGQERVVPTNWMHVVINEQKIDWLNFGRNYNDVVTQAVNEAAGHGFVTEYAGTTENFQNIFYTEGQFNLDALMLAEGPAEFVMMLLNQGFPRDSVMQNLIRKHIPKPAELVEQGVTDQEFYNCLECYQEYLGQIEFDAEAFVADIEDKVIGPLQSAQEQVDNSRYMTRMFTTVSPDEMTRDPIFVQNGSLPDVSNQHTATAKPICTEDGQSIEKVIVTLESGETIEIEGDWTDPWVEMPTPEPDPTVATALRIELIGTTGDPVVVDPSQVDAVDQQLDTRDPEAVIEDLRNGVIPTVVTDPTTNSGGGASGGGSGVSGCAGAPAAPLAPIALSILSLLALGIRRRQ